MVYCNSPAATQASLELITLTKLFVVTQTRLLEVFFVSLYLLFDGSAILTALWFAEVSQRRCRWFIHQFFVITVAIVNQDEYGSGLGGWLNLCRGLGFVRVKDHKDVEEARVRKSEVAVLLQ